MYIIESIRDKKSWISVIVKDKKEAQVHFERLSSNSDGVSHNLVYTPIDDYPFNVIETFETRPPQFTYLTEQATKDYLMNLTPVDDEDHQYCILFTILEDYVSPRYGEDYMGILVHDHVNNDFLKYYKSKQS